ncbi:MAG: hypothetical protein AMXMBFR48_29500 [Ignavibacteriales bacterium]
MKIKRGHAPGIRKAEEFGEKTEIDLPAGHNHFAGVGVIYIVKLGCFKNGGVFFNKEGVAAENLVHGV